MKYLIVAISIFVFCFPVFAQAQGREPVLESYIKAGYIHHVIQMRPEAAIDV